MNRLRPALLIAALLAAPQLPCAAVAFAQSPARPAPTGLALEVTYLKGRPPSYKVVPSGPEPRGGWHALFGRVPGWRPPEGSLPTQAVNVVSRPEDDQVRVIVSVYQGVRFHEKEALVSAHLLRVNERVEVSGLTRFGVEPFVIKVVRVAPLPTNPPALVSRAPSIAFTGATPVGDATLPAHRVSVQNLSAKDVVALGVEVRVGGQVKLSTIRQGRDGERLMAGGGAYDFELTGAREARPAADGYAPAAPHDQEVHITAAVFADGSAEGDDYTAASFRAFVYGRRAQIARLLPLFREALAAADEDGVAAAKRFHERVSALDDAAAPSDLEALWGEFPALGRGKDLRTAVEVVMNGVRRDLLTEVEKFTLSETEQPGATSFRAWLGANKERFERWLARL
jgi:hypothetical protein